MTGLGYGGGEEQRARCGGVSSGGGDDGRRKRRTLGLVGCGADRRACYIERLSGPTCWRQISFGRAESRRGATY
jgi:hypothetical protein